MNYDETILLSEDSDDERNNKKMKENNDNFKYVFNNQNDGDVKTLHFGFSDDHSWNSPKISNIQPSTSKSNCEEEEFKTAFIEYSMHGKELTSAIDEHVVTEEDRTVAVKRRKIRTKEEIEQQKLEKEINKIRREIQMSKNSKCEKYLYCYISSRVLALDDALKEELKKRFEERDIPNQLQYDYSNANMMRVYWKRKRIEASYMEDGKLHSSEIMELQSRFYCILAGDTFTVLAKTKNGILHYLQDQISAHKTKERHPTLLIIGKHTVRDNILTSLILDAYERYNAQFRFVQDSLDFSFAVVQMHRSLAKFEKKSEKQMQAEELGTTGNHFIAEKGHIAGIGMVSDWWSKMLDHVHRLTEEQKRAIVQSHPNPIKLMDNLSECNNSPGTSMYLLSEIQMESGRRLGPALAQKIYKMLTNFDGIEVIDSEA